MLTIDIRSLPMLETVALICLPWKKNSESPGWSNPSAPTFTTRLEFDGSPCPAIADWHGRQFSGKLLSWRTRGTRLAIYMAERAIPISNARRHDREDRSDAE